MLRVRSTHEERLDCKEMSISDYFAFFALLQSDRGWKLLALRKFRTNLSHEHPDERFIVAGRVLDREEETNDATENETKGLLPPSFSLILQLSYKEFYIWNENESWSVCEP